MFPRTGRWYSAGMDATTPAAAPSLFLLTDLYQLTMAYGYWRLGLAERRAVFHLTFRQQPFGGGYAIAGGLGPAVDYLTSLQPTAADLDYLATLVGNDGRPLFDPAFLAWLDGCRFTGDLDAVPEGSVVFANEPLLRVEGPLLQCQLVETALLNQINFSTLVATKAARVRVAAGDEPVLEFGLRRAQGPDGGLTASRAAYLGGADATSNVLAGHRYGIPVRGTHAHSWVMCFPDEPTAFAAYARVLPNNCVFLVDTYDTLEGVRHAIAAARELRAQGHELVGIRLDSGDLAYLSQQARRLLDEAGFPGAKVLASNDLDERLIESLHLQEAAIDLWGVGTRLVTGGEQAALGGVYKLAALAAPDGGWEYPLKLSEQAIKITTPGRLGVRRFCRQGEIVADCIYDLDLGLLPGAALVDPRDATRQRPLEPELTAAELLVPVLRAGQPVGARPTLAESRQHTLQQLAALHPGVQRLATPHELPVGLEPRLAARRTRLIGEARARVRERRTPG